MSIRTDIKLVQHIADLRAVEEKRAVEDKARAVKAEKARIVKAWVASLAPTDRYVFEWRARRSLPPTEALVTSLTNFLRR